MKKIFKPIIFSFMVLSMVNIVEVNTKATIKENPSATIRWVDYKGNEVIRVETNEKGIGSLKKEDILQSVTKYKISRNLPIVLIGLVTSSFVGFFMCNFRKEREY